MVLFCAMMLTLTFNYLHPHNDFSSPDSPPVKVVNVHSPASSAPVCTDPASFKKPSSSKIPANLKELPNGEIASLVLQDVIKDHQLEKLLDPHRAVEVRRLKFDSKLDSLGQTGALSELPHKHDLDWYGWSNHIEWGECLHPHGYHGGVSRGKYQSRM